MVLNSMWKGKAIKEGITMKRKLISVLIVAVIIFTLVGSVHTAADVALTVNASVDKYETVTEAEGDSQLACVADECSILRYVDEKDFLSNDFIRRVETEESLNTYVFERADGTRRLYLLGEDIKFEAADGTILEKDITLNKIDEGYATTRNNVGLSISDSFSDGVQIDFGDNKLSVLPADTNVNYSATIRDNTIIYYDVYGEGTELDFTPTLSGVKQNIILNSYEGINEFEYIVFSETLSPFSGENDVYFAESEDSDYRFEFGSVYIYDAAGRFTYGDIEITEIDECNWLITIVAQTEFLESENTVYPLTVDPTIQVKASDSTTYIEDTTIYSGKPNLNTGSWQYNHTGLISDGYDVGRMLVRIPGLYVSNSTYANMSAEHINNASFCIYEASGSTGQRVDLYSYGGLTWSESTATWNNTTPTGFGTLIDTKYPASGSMTTYTITNLVKGWKSGSYTASKGFMLKSLNESDGNKYKAFDSSSSSSSARRPYLVLDYTPTITINSSVNHIDEGDTLSLTALTQPSGLTVNWYSSNPAVASVDSNGVVTGWTAKSESVVILACVTVDGVSYTDSCQLYVTIPEGVYYIKNENSNLYLSVEGGSCASLTDVIQTAKVPSQIPVPYHLCQMWKIKYLNNGRYSVRPMHKLDNGLEVSSGNVDMFPIGTTDDFASVSNSAKWTIERSSNASSGCVLKNQGSSASAMHISGGSSLSNASVVVGQFASTADFRWTFEEIQDPPEGVLLYDMYTSFYVSNPTRYVSLYDECGLTTLQLRAAVFSGQTLDQSVLWFSYDSNIASVDYVTGKVTAVSPGATTILAYKYIAGSGTTYFATYNLVVTDISDGTYFLKNKQNSDFARVKNGYLSNNQNAVQYDFDGTGYERWIFKLDNRNGYYSIKSYPSNELFGYYLAVKDDSSALNHQVVIRSATESSLTDGMMWKVETTSSGAYKLIPKTGEASDYVLTTSTSDGTNNADLIQGAYVLNSSYRDEWYIVSFGSQQFRELASSQYTQINCHGYAMMRNDIPDSTEWRPLTTAYLATIVPSISGEYSDIVKNGYSGNLKADFENWLSDNGYSFVYEYDFSGNGDYRTLQPNQYRVVLRGGLKTSHITNGYNIYYTVMEDYHFWYQTSNGQWANKHGSLPFVSGPQLLDVGVMPSSVHTLGWALDYYNESYELIDRDWDFYDCQVYSYIITIQD